MNRQIRCFFIAASFLFLISDISFAKPKSNKSKSNAKKEKVEEVEVISDAFSVYQEDFATLMRSAIECARYGNYSGALDKFDGYAFSLTREGYESNKNNAKKLTQLDLLVADVRKNLSDYRALMATKNFEGEVLEKCVSLRNKIQDLGLQIQGIDFKGYPSYVAKIVLGVRGEELSGIIGAMDAEFYSVIEKLQNEIFKKCDEESEKFSKCLVFENVFGDQSAFSTTEQNIKNIKQYASELKNLEKYRSLVNNIDSRKKNEISRFNKSMDAVSTFCDETHRVTRIIGEMCSEVEKKHVPPENPVDALRKNNNSYAEDLIESAKNFSLYGKASLSASRSESLNTLKNFTDEKLSWNKFVSPFKNFCLMVENYSSKTAVEYWISVSNFYADTGKLLYESDKNDCDEIKKYLLPQDGVFYPSRSVTLLEKLKDNIQVDKKVLNECKLKLNDGYIYRSNFISQTERITDNAEKISEIEKDFNRIANDSREKILAARLAKNEIDFFYDKSSEFYKAGKFEQAFENYQKASDAYAKLIDRLKSDGDVQSELFSRLSKLRNDIIARQKPIFFSEIRKMKGNARNSYYAGNFTEASSIIMAIERKRSVWEKLTDSTLEPDVELNKLSDFVNTAIAIKEGRDISPYDSKAPEMLQNLSIAMQYFNQAEKLMASGDRAAAENLLNVSKAKINHVKIYYPRNREAGTLGLKIERLLSPKDFDEMYKSKISELKGIDFSSKSVPAQEGYSSLLDLYEINPSYPGIKDLIYKAEVGLGLKRKPVENKNASKALKIASEAQTLFNKAGRDEVLLEQAKRKAMEALAIDSENEKALSVLDEISFRTGTESAVVLSAKDEELYQKALEDLKKNNVIEANVKISELLKTKSNARSAKIMKLKKRIEAQL